MGKTYTITKNDDVNEWLSEYRNPSTRIQMKTRLQRFIDAIGMDINDFISLPPKEAKHKIKKYVAETNSPNNTVLSLVTAPRALFDYLDKPIKFRTHELPKPQMARNKHRFSNGDLSKLLETASVRMKCLVSLGASLGWAISDVLALDKNYIQTLTDRARENNERFIFFHAERKKTGAKAFGVLNPIAITWLEKWLAINKSDSLFGITADMINKNLQRLAKEAQLKLTGNVSFHCFRAWTFSSLIKAGFSEFEAKYCVGKAIPLSDATYLSLEESIKEKYRQVYNRYLNIQPTAAQTKDLQQALRQAEKDIKERDQKISALETRLEQLRQKLNKITTDFEDRLDWLENKHKKKVKVDLT